MRGHLTTHRYLVALGSNMRMPGVGMPREVLKTAVAALEASGLNVGALSLVSDSIPIGPSRRRYANAMALVTTSLEPPELLAILQSLERRFGRRRRGAPWRARTLDLDIVLWSGGSWRDAALIIPHPLFRGRDFVLGPATAIARGWRDPSSGLTLGQLHARLTRPRPLPR